MAAAFVYWWICRWRRPRLISLVALLREAVTFDPAILAKAAGKVWHADLGDGALEGADGFAVGVGEMNTIKHEGRLFMTPNIIYCFEDQDVVEAAQLMKDNQVRRLVVVNADRRLVGIVSLGDLAVDIGAEELAGHMLEAVSVPSSPAR